MAIENLPRPWLLAALTGLRVAELLGPDDRLAGDRPPRQPLPRAAPRRRRLGEALAQDRRDELAKDSLN